MKWWDWMPWSSVFECWVLSQLFHSSFTFIKRLFSVSLLSARRVMSSAFLRLLIFFPSVLTPACASSSPTFHLMYSAYELNKQGDNIQPWHTPFPIWNQSVCSMSGSNCCFLTYVQVSQEAGKVVWYSHLFQIFPQFVVIHTVKVSGLVNKAGVGVFWNSLIFPMIWQMLQRMRNLQWHTVCYTACYTYCVLPFMGTCCGLQRYHYSALKIFYALPVLSSPTPIPGNHWPFYFLHNFAFSRMLYCCSVTESYPTLCNRIDCSTPGFPVLHQLLDLSQTHIHRVGDAIQPSHPLSSPFPPAFSLSQHQDLF